MLYDLCKITAGPEKLRPCLIGPTGSGKTARIKEVAKALGLPLKTLLLHHMLEEEIAGIPKAVRDTVHKLPNQWAKELAKEPHVLFLDELDKARRSLHGAILTMLWDARIDDTVFHPDTVIVCAMQPVDVESWLATETGKALSARLVFVPVSYNRAYVQQVTGVDFGGFPEPDKAQPPVLPVPSDRQLVELVSLCRRLPEEHWETVAEGVLPKALVRPFIERLQHAQSITPQTLYKALVQGRIQLSQLEVPEILAVSTEIISNGPVDLYEQMLYNLWTRGCEDDLRAFLVHQYEHLMNNLDAEGYVTYVGDATEDEVVQALARAADNIAVELMKRSKKT